MKYQNLYIIHYKDLSNGSYDYDFDIDKAFFENIEESEINDGQLHMQVTMQKTEAGLTLEYDLQGTVSIQCDRCLDFFDSNVELNGTLRVVFEQVEKDDNLELETINLLPDDEELDLTHFIYESILLSLPVQKVHPNNEKGKPTCNKEMLKLLKKHSSDKKTNETDPRWDELKNFRNLN